MQRWPPTHAFTTGALRVDTTHRRGFARHRITRIVARSNTSAEAIQHNFNILSPPIPAKHLSHLNPLFVIKENMGRW